MPSRKTTTAGVVFVPKIYSRTKESLATSSLKTSVEEFCLTQPRTARSTVKQISRAAHCFQKYREKYLWDLNDTMSTLQPLGAISLPA